MTGPEKELDDEAKHHYDSKHSARQQDPESGTALDGDVPPPPLYSVFSKWQKRGIVLAATLGAFYSPFSGQIYLPSLPSVAADLGVSVSRVNLTVTTYIAVQALMPMLIGSLADSGGRRPAYIVCFCVYVTACIGLALVPSYGGVLALRCLQSAGSSPLPALSNAVISDVATSAERGSYAAFTALPAVFGPALGPVIGGLLSQSLGWRFIFWFLAALGAVYIIPIAVFFPETCRHIVDDGSAMPPPLYRNLWQVIKLRRIIAAGTTTTPENGENGGQEGEAPGSSKKFKFKMPNLLGSVFILFEKETGLLLGSGSMTMTGIQALATSMSTEIPHAYGLNETQVGLMYLPFALGAVVAAVVVGRAMTWNFRRHCSRLGLPFDGARQMELAGFPIERARLEIGLPLLFLGSAALAGWGWVVEARAHLALAGVMSALQGVGMMGYSGTAYALLADIHPGKVGTAMAANNLTRGLMGAAATAAIGPMIEAVGIGWSGTILILPCLAFVPGLLLVMSRGPKWRAQLAEKRRRKAERKENAGG